MALSDKDIASFSRTPNPLALRDVPNVQDAELRAFLQALKDIVETRLIGRSGNYADRAVLFRDALNTGLINVTAGSTVISGSGVSGITFNGTSGDGPTDNLPPPAPTGVIASAGLTSIIVQWNAADSDRIAYAEVWAAGTDNLGQAVLIGTAIGSLYSDPVGATGVTRYYWVRFIATGSQAVPGSFQSVGGVGATTGKVGNSDLSDLIVTAGKLANGAVLPEKAVLDIGGGNLLGNNSFDIDSVSDGMADGWAVYDLDGVSVPASMVPGRLGGLAQRISWVTNNGSTKGVYAVDSSEQYAVRGGWIPNKTYVLSFYARATGTNVGQLMSLQWNIGPTMVVLSNPPLTSDWQRYAFRLIWGASTEPSRRLYLSIAYASGTSGTLDFDDVQVEEGATLSGYFGKLAANTIVAGDAAIGNAAITNAQIGNLAVDSAKIADAAIVTAKIGDAAITTAKIGDAQITNAKVQNLDAGKLTTGVLLADRIGANTITFNKLQSQIFHSMAINPDPGCEDITAWQVGGSVVKTAVSGLPFGAFAWMSSTGGEIYTKRVPIDRNLVYRLSMYATRGSVSDTATMYLLAAFYDVNGNLIYGDVDPQNWPATGTFHYYGLMGTAPPATWTEYAITFGAGQTVGIPTNARYIGVGSLLNYSGAGAGTNFVGNVRLQQVNPGVLIQDGAISAQKLSVAQLSAITATIGLLRTSASGARTEIEDNRIRVFDSAGNIRVKIGSLA